MTGRCRRWACPVCGLFGRKARKRAQLAADAAHVALFGWLAQTTHDERQMALPCPICKTPNWAGWACDDCDPLAEVPRTLLPGWGS